MWCHSFHRIGGVATGGVGVAISRGDGNCCKVTSRHQASGWHEVVLTTASGSARWCRVLPSEWTSEFTAQKNDEIWEGKIMYFWFRRNAPVIQITFTCRFAERLWDKRLAILYRVTRQVDDLLSLTSKWKFCHSTSYTKTQFSILCPKASKST